MRVSGQPQALAGLSPGKNHGARFIGGWLGHSVGLIGLDKRKLTLTRHYYCHQQQLPARMLRVSKMFTRYSTAFGRSLKSCLIIHSREEQMGLVVLLALLTMWVLRLRKLAQEMMWHSSDVDCCDSRSDLTSVCSGSEAGYTSEEDGEGRRVGSWHT